MPTATETSGSGDAAVVDKAYWSQPAAELFARLGSGADGLTHAEAAARLTRYGPNAVRDEQQYTIPRLVLRQFASPLVLILVVGAFVALIVRSWTDAWLILAIVIGSAALGFTQEYRASNAVAALRRRLALDSRVIRAGVAATIPARNVVPGDILVLAAGTLVAADGIVLAAADLLVGEAALTGEAFPVEKRPGVVAAEAPLAARTNALFLGSSVRSGTGRMLVVHTGRDTALAAIAGELRGREAETEFTRGIRRFGVLLVQVMTVMVLLVLTINLMLGRPPVDSLMFALALAVGMSPELLPAITAITLAAGARALAKQGVLVRRLEAIENLGSMDVLCTDKTGTITEGEIVLEAATDPDGNPSKEVATLAFVNSAFETGIENPLDRAILAAGTRDGRTTAGNAKVDEIPYDFSRKRLTIVVADATDPSRHRIVTKGAFAEIVGICTTIARANGPVPLDAAQRALIEALFRDHGTKGRRVLALATKNVAPKPSYVHADEAAMTFVGLLVFSDPLKAGIDQTLRKLAATGVAVKIVSGDSRYVTAHVGEAIGLDSAAMLTGNAIANLTDEALWHLAERTDLFAEVEPQQKERIVRALQRTGHAVGYLGDGINDAPALQAADVGISVDSATDVARQSADIVLLRSDLDVLRGGVEGGRRTLANTLKYISITTSGNFGNMLSMALATPWLPFLPMTASQILLTNFLTDIPQMAVASDAVDPERIARPRHWSVPYLRRFMVVFGVISTLFDMVTFLVLLQVFAADEATFRTGWFVVSLLTELGVVLVLRTTRPAWQSRPSPLLLTLTLAIAASGLLLPYLPAAELIGFRPLPLGLLLAMILTVLGYLAASEIAKVGLSRGTFRWRWSG